MAYIKTMLKKFFGNMDDVSNEEEHIYPVTSTEAVFDKNNNTLDSIVTSIKNSLKVIDSNIEYLTIKINNIPNIENNNGMWDGNIVEQFQGFYSPQDNEIITGSAIGTYGDILWDNIRNIFVYKVENSGTYSYYRGWSGFSRYMKDVDTPHNKLFKHDNILYYYNEDLNKLINIYDQEYLEAVEIVQTQDCVVHWERNSSLTFTDVTGLPIVYIQHPLCIDIMGGAAVQFEGPVFAYRITKGYQSFDYFVPYGNFSTYLLSNYQDMDGNIKEGLKVKINNVIYQYNSSTQTLERV